MDENESKLKDMKNDQRQSHYMLNYNAMVIFFFVGLLAIKMESWLSVIITLLGFFISSPSIQFNRQLYRWLTLSFLFIILILTFPDLSLLQDKI